MPTKTPKTKTAAKVPAKAKPATVKAVKVSPKSKQKLLSTPAPELELPAAPLEMQLPAGKIGRSKRKKYPFIGIVLILLLIGVGAAYYCIWQINILLDDYCAKVASQPVTKHEEPAFAVPKIIADEQLLTGDYYFGRDAWSADAAKFIATQAEAYSEYGLPEKVSTFIIDLNAKKLFLLSENAELHTLASPISWESSTTAVTGGQIYDFSDLEKITVKPEAKKDLTGFELIDTFQTIDPETNKSVSTVYVQEISPDGSYLAVIVGGAGPELKVIPKGAAEAEAMLNFGRVRLSPEGDYTLSWSRDSRYLIVNDEELVDVKSNLVKLSFLGSADMAGMNQRLILSPDETKLLVIEYPGDVNTGKPSQIRVYVKDLATGEEKEIFDLAPYDAVNALMPYRENGGFTPDSKYVIFYYQSRLWMADAATGKRKPVTEPGKDYFDMLLAPDGNKILYLVPGREVRMLTLQ